MKLRDGHLQITCPCCIKCVRRKFIAKFLWDSRSIIGALLWFIFIHFGAAILTIRLVPFLIALIGFWAGFAFSEPDNLVEQGRRIYQLGVLPDGSALASVGAAGTAVSGQRAACVSCHRRSGMGGREGGRLIAPITGPILFAKAVPYWPVRPNRPTPPVTPMRQDSRSAYDSTTLVQAIREGIDPDGNALSELMPRFQLDALASKALVAYLQQLSAAPAPGLSPQMLQLATIITPDADSSRSKTVVETLTAWAKGGALGGMPINFQVWRLEGNSSTWGEQLERFYKQQQPFAVISGAGGAQWKPVSDFCERTGTPCLFPVVDLAQNDDTKFYSLYFSTGVPLEAQLLHGYLETLSPKPRRIIQLVGSFAGESAATQLAESLPAMSMETRRWSTNLLAQLISDLQPDDLLIGWLSTAQLQALSAAVPQVPQGSQVIFSAQLAPPDKTNLPVAWRERARWISARSDPTRRHGNAVIGLVPWAQHLQLPLDDEALMADIYAATYYFGDALARMRGRWNREYLIETLENADYRRAVGGAYYLLSMAAGQREAAKSGHIQGFVAPDYQRIQPIGDRLVP